MVDAYPWTEMPGEGYFFQTQSGSVYGVKIKAADYGIFKSDALDPNIVLIDLGLFATPVGMNATVFKAAKAPRDSRISVTIAEIVDIWFDANPDKVALLIFYDDDGKARKRSLYFNKLTLVAGKGKYKLFPFLHRFQSEWGSELQALQEDYCGLLYRVDNPLAAQLEKTLNENIREGILTAK